MKIENIIERQRTFFNSNQTKDIGFRIEKLKKVKFLLKENESLLYKAIYEDFGKSEFETYASELSPVYHEINIAIKNVKKWSKIKKVPTGLTNFPAKSYIIPEPLGTALIIGAWNYPYQLSIVPAITALAAGNTVILKPSELPSRTSNAMAKLINNNFDSSYFHVVEGGVLEATELLEHRFDKIFFTGSIPVGRLIYQAAAKHLTPVTLELGGKSPTFVFSDCDIKTTAKRIAWAKFLNAGQTCVAPDYILVEKSAEENFLNALFKELDKYPQSYQDFSDHYTQIINTKNFDRLCELIDNAKVCYGGTTDRDARFISPTVLKNVSFDDKIMEDEIFGPVLPVISFADLNATIYEVKMRPKPLACYIYSTNSKTVKKLLKEISFGGGAVNDSVMHLSNSNLPFGGVGFSGIGSYHAKAGFNAFSHYKSILHKPFWFEPSLKYPPYSQEKMRWIKRIMK
ncbi:MAG: aldehyde dehydrogenase [Candidatus Cloacimonetes bacterium]|nr:aldehyde dehydrogenase [Candidatus Cloacimonadota bacterium]